MFYVHPYWGRFPFWLIFFKWVETTTGTSGSEVHVFVLPIELKGLLAAPRRRIGIVGGDKNPQKRGGVPSTDPVRWHVISIEFHIYIYCLRSLKRGEIVSSSLMICIPGAVARQAELKGQTESFQEQSRLCTKFVLNTTFWYLIETTNCRFRFSLSSCEIKASGPIQETYKCNRNHPLKSNPGKYIHPTSMGPCVLVNDMALQIAERDSC